MSSPSLSFCIILILFTTLISCMPPRQGDLNALQKIEQIWALSDQNSDSAATACKDMEGMVYTCSEYVRMKYDLLNIRIRYKQDIPASSTDSIWKVATYMEKYGTDKDKMRVYYYLAGIHEDLHDSPKALEYTLKSLKYKDNPQACDTAIVLNCYSQLSYIYRQQRNTKEAISTALGCLEFAKHTGKDICWYLVDAAASYDAAEEHKKAMEYYDKAYRHLLAKKNYRANLQLIAEMMHVFTHYEKYEIADTLASIIEKIPDHERMYAYHFAKGIMSHAAKENSDSVIEHFKKSADMAPSIRFRLTSLSNLFRIYCEKGDFQKATEYAWQFQKGVRELHKVEQQEWTRNAKGMYDYQKNKEQEEALFRQNMVWKLRGTMAICALLCTFSAFSVFYLYRRKKMLEANANKERELSELQETLQAKNKEIREKEEELQEQKQHSREIEEELARKKVQTEELTRLSRLTQARTEFGQAIEEIEKAARTGKGISEEKWQELLCAVDAQFPTFRATISERLPRINETLLRTCYLLKIGMSNQQIEVLTQSAHQTVWNRVKKIREALGEESPREEEEE